MKRMFLLLVLFFVNLSISLGQQTKEPILMEKVFGGYQFTQGGKRLNFSQLSEIMKPNEVAFQEIKAAQSNNTLAAVFGGAGGFLIGYPVGTALGGGEPNWTMAAIGAGLVVIAIPIGQKANKQAKNAVENCNSSLNSSSFKMKTDFKLAFTGNGIGLTLKF